MAIASTGRRLAKRMRAGPDRVRARLRRLERADGERGFRRAPRSRSCGTRSPKLPDPRRHLVSSRPVVAGRRLAVRAAPARLGRELFYSRASSRGCTSSCCAAQEKLRGTANATLAPGQGLLGAKPRLPTRDCPRRWRVAGEETRRRRASSIDRGYHRDRVRSSRSPTTSNRSFEVAAVDGSRPTAAGTTAVAGCPRLTEIVGRRAWRAGATATTSSMVRPRTRSARASSLRLS